MVKPVQNLEKLWNSIFEKVKAKIINWYELFVTFQYINKLNKGLFTWVFAWRARAAYWGQEKSPSSVWPKIYLNNFQKQGSIYSNSLISISLKPNGVNFSYFKLKTI